jgi:hypothetical protein
MSTKSVNDADRLPTAARPTAPGSDFEERNWGGGVSPTSSSDGRRFEKEDLSCPVASRPRDARTPRRQGECVPGRGARDDGHGADAQHLYDAGTFVSTRSRDGVFGSGFQSVPNQKGRFVKRLNPSLKGRVRATARPALRRVGLRRANPTNPTRGFRANPNPSLLPPRTVPRMVAWAVLWIVPLDNSFDGLSTGPL